MDEYYERLGILFAQTRFGQDSFDGEVLFGGQSFNVYRATVGVLVGWMLKHGDFCSELLIKRPEIKPQNIFTIFSTVDELIAQLSAALDVDGHVAEQALLMLSMGPEHKATGIVTPGGPAAPFVQIGQRRLLRSYRGILDAPFFYMLRNLKHYYRKDWDSAVDQREKAFRDELYGVFQNAALVKINRSVDLKVQGQVVSDLDAVVFDPRSGVLGLFQLKWQDPFGPSMTERASRKSNFLKNAERWISIVTAWMAGRPLVEIGREIGLRRDLAEKLRTVRLFVLGRNFAHFSGTDEIDKRAAWGHWSQVLRLVVENKFDQSNPIEWLYQALEKDSPLSREIALPSREHVKIGDVGITVEWGAD